MPPEWFLTWLREAPAWQTIPAALAENFVLLAVALALGELAARVFSHRRVALPAPPLSRAEIDFTVVALLTNTLTTLAGLLLWRLGVIEFRADTGLWALLDIPLILLVMDGAMYALHRIAHLPWLYPWLHRAHHEYDRPRPLTLFILNPLENLAFGALMLGVLAAYPFSWLATVFYLTFNLASGIVGHLGVEPLPDWWARTPLLRSLTGGSFHARHHQDPACNFGFYTLIWDRLFRTLRKDYWARFGKLPG
jgi:sterol desaturase/sphingolipid hydroxylase (fatty acid hydroxylase superfamily)